MQKKILSISCLLLCTALMCWGQGTNQTLQKDSSTASPDATIQDFSWIAGTWRGEAMGGTIEEIWSEPMAHTMMGSFKLAVDNKIVFYELCILREVQQSVLLQIKHFSNELDGWEEKDESEDFSLIKVEDGAAYFDGITFKLIQPDELHIYVLIEEGSSVEEHAFVYHRVK